MDFSLECFSIQCWFSNICSFFFHLCLMHRWTVLDNIALCFFVTVFYIPHGQTHSCLIYFFIYKKATINTLKASKDRRKGKKLVMDSTYIRYIPSPRLPTFCLISRPINVPFSPQNPADELGGGQGQNDLTDPLTSTVYNPVL